MSLGGIFCLGASRITQSDVSYPLLLIHDKAKGDGIIYMKLVTYSCVQVKQWCTRDNKQYRHVIKSIIQFCPLAYFLRLES